MRLQFSETHFVYNGFCVKISKWLDCDLTCNSKHSGYVTFQFYYVSISTHQNFIENISLSM